MLPFSLAMLSGMRPCVFRWVMTAVVVAGMIATLPLSNSGALALHIQPRVLSEHWLVPDVEGYLSDTTEDTTDQISTTPQDFDTTEVFPTTMMPTTTEVDLESRTLPPSIAAVLHKSPGLPWDIDVEDLLINIPNPICPQGYQADLRGKCRQVFGFQAFNRGYQGMPPPLLGSFIKRNRPHNNALS